MRLILFIIFLNTSLIALNPEKRPESLQQSIDKTFKSLSSSRISFKYYGAADYDLPLDGKLLVKSLIKAVPEQKIFNIIDLGAGDGSWGNSLARFINENKEIPDDITVNIYNVNAERGFEVPQKIGKCNLFFYYQFKLENFNEAIDNAKIDIKQKIDLAVSSFTFLHLHDPAGTFQQVFNALRPGTGIIMTDGFPVLFKGSESVQFLHINWFKFLYAIRAQAPALMTMFGERKLPAILVKRIDEKELSIPADYVGTQYLQVAHALRKSSAVLQFSKQIKFPKFRFFNLYGNPKFLGTNIQLFDWLLQHHQPLHEEMSVWKPIDKSIKIKQTTGLENVFALAKNRQFDKVIEKLNVNQISSNGDLLSYWFYLNEKAKMLLSFKDLDPNTKDRLNRTNFMWIAKSKDVSAEEIKELSESVKDINAQDNNGETVFHHLVETDLPLEKIQTLIDLGANINLQDNSGNTALHLVMRSTTNMEKRIEMVKLLLSANANYKLKNKRGEKPFALHAIKDERMKEAIVKIVGKEIFRRYW
jgi:SAM-dependent methyltransferase